MEEKFDFMAIVDDVGNKRLVRIDFVAYIDKVGDGCLIYLKNGNIIESGFSFSELEPMLNIIYSDEIN